MTQVITTNSASLAAECQTEPIMVPFPLPPIGRVGPEPKPLESVSMQTEYTWMFSEFPTRDSSISVCERESVVVPVPDASEPAPKAALPKKKQASPKKPVVVAPVAQEEPKKVPALEITTEPVEMEVDSTSTEAETQMAVVAEAVAAPAEEVSVPAVVQETPRKRTRAAKKEAEPVTPATPATSAGPETPASASSPASTPETAAPRRSVSLKPILSDSSDDDCPLLNKAAPLTRTITPVSVKPSVATKVRPVSSPVQAPQTLAAAPAAAESASESEAEANQSSSSDSDADIPSASLIASSKRKHAQATKPTVTKPEPLPGNTRLGPLVQVENVNESHIETIHKKILEMIPEPLRGGAIKEAVADEANKRLIFQLRISPKVVQFIGAAGGSVKINDSEQRDLVVLSEAQKKKAAGLFKNSGEDEKSAKRRR